MHVPFIEMHNLLNVLSRSDELRSDALPFEAISQMDEEGHGSAVHGRHSGKIEVDPRRGCRFPENQEFRRLVPERRCMRELEPPADANDARGILRVAHLYGEPWVFHRRDVQKQSRGQRFPRALVDQTTSRCRYGHQGLARRRRGKVSWRPVRQARSCIRDFGCAAHRASTERRGRIGKLRTV